MRTPTGGAIGVALFLAGTLAGAAVSVWETARVCAAG